MPITNADVRAYVLEDLNALATSPRTYLPATDAGEVAYEVGREAQTARRAPRRSAFVNYRAEIADAMYVAAVAVSGLGGALDYDELDFDSRNAIDAQDLADALALLDEESYR